MGQRQKEWARNKRTELLLILGMQCIKCNATKDLEFDCIEPRGDVHHKYDTSHRMSFYWQQWEEGNLQVLCKSCHNIKSTEEAKVIPW